MRVNKSGRISIPKEILLDIGVTQNDSVEIILASNVISIQKQKVTCLVTGKASSDIVKYSGGITLSREGSKLLLNDLKKFT